MQPTTGFQVFISMYAIFMAIKQSIKKRTWRELNLEKSKKDTHISTQGKWKAIISEQQQVRKHEGYSNNTSHLFEMTSNHKQQWTKPALPFSSLETQSLNFYPKSKDPTDQLDTKIQPNI